MVTTRHSQPATRGVDPCRVTFHNHNDVEAVMMLRAVPPALKVSNDPPVLLIRVQKRKDCGSLGLAALTGKMQIM
jgi:hypothetical protein